ncbi:TPA: DUF6575 domain-containing protein [Serratia marcescens]|uniref:DUF6575 domain-containing protein n=1 Tax=Serratia ureilytica TaxID=300181 RepID=UPI0018D8A372|nr:DUF6575 domain-containing protein [Serratia ureilytica]MBH3319161.1 hypothetical protein [Serratia ureilytica]
MEFFACHPVFGKLRIVNVYLEFDGPKIFYAENEIGTTFFVYWVGDDADFECWYIIPCSKNKIIAFEKKKLSLRSILEKQEQEYFYDVRLPFQLEGELQFNIKHKNKIAEIALPEPDVYVKKVDIYSPSLLANDLVPTHEIIVSKVAKKSKTNVSLGKLSVVFDRFSELVFGFNISHKVSGSMQALNARYGSFAISLHADNLEKFEVFLGSVSDIMVRKLDVEPILKLYNIDYKVFLNFLKAIELSNVDFELRSSEEPDKIIKIYKFDAEIYLMKLKKVSIEYISSIKVPQANDIEKVFKYVELKWNNIPVTAEVLQIHPRLIDYYKHALNILGFMEYNGTLTPQGERLALSDITTKYRITANAFEASECVWAWMSLYDLKDFFQIDSTTAADFLTARCPSLSGKTIGRRANTLASWYKQLRPHYVSVNSTSENKNT